MLAVYADPNLGPDAATLLKWFIARKTTPPELGQYRQGRQDIAEQFTNQWPTERSLLLLQRLLDAGRLEEHDGALGVVD